MIIEETDGGKIPVKFSGNVSLKIAQISLIEFKISLDQ
jgi:hypothetical protein